MRVAKDVQNSHVPNCDGIWQQVGLNLNLLKWAEYVDNYEDTRLLQILVYGFPLGIGQVTLVDKTLKIIVPH